MIKLNMRCMYLGKMNNEKRSHNFMCDSEEAVNQKIKK